MTRRDNRSSNSAIATSRGFTLVESVVVLAAFGLIMAVAFGIFTTLSSTTMQNSQVARSQAGARVALEEIERSLRSAGAEVDLARGQQNFVWAGPYQLAFNANLTPINDPAGIGEPGALIAGAGGAGVPSDAGALYIPPFTYNTGAETVLFTLDSNRDGLINDADKADDIEEESLNPNDYVLYRGVFGAASGANQADHRPIAIVRGPELTEPGERNMPLFSYWLDDDDDSATPAVLAGDANGDGEVTVNEAIALGPLGPRDRTRIERVTITVTSETDVVNPNRDTFGGYERVELSTDVKIRQAPRSAAIMFGVVFRDINSNGTHDPSEPTIPDVIIQTSNGAQTVTNVNGQYLVTVTPGMLTLRELDPVGFGSSTPNTVNVDAYPGSFTRIDFGDVPSTGTAQIQGMVFNDADQTGTITDGDRGIANVKVYSDTGEYVYTDIGGKYTLDVPVGTRTISQVDSVGYVSTTPNIVEAEVPDAGDVFEVNFGDAYGVDTGTLEGYVYLDEDRDGRRDKGETSGVFGASIVAGAAGSTESDVQGYFTLTLPVGEYQIVENDPPGYSSTTPNILSAVRIKRDQTTTVYFGDFVQEDVDFEVIELSDTEKALSIAAGDFGEDRTGDPDIVLGTRFSGGSNNMLVWINNRKNSKTPNTAIFNSAPSTTRASRSDVTGLIAEDLDRDGDDDVIAGLATTKFSDLTVWSVDAGAPSELPDFEYQTDNGEIVRDLQHVDVNRDGVMDLVLAVDEVGVGGHAEIWWGQGGGAYYTDSTSFVSGAADGVYTPLLTVTSARCADLNGDGAMDLVLAEFDGSLRSRVHVYLNASDFGGFKPAARQNFHVAGEITQLHLGDQVEDDQGDVDIVLAVQGTDVTGHVEVWHQYPDGYFGLVDESARIANDRMLTNGAPVSMRVMRLDNDIFPDILVGTRRNTGFEGTVEYALGFGHLLSETIPITDTSLGAVLTMTDADFNMDGVMDLAVGTQTSSTGGKLFVFFRK